MEKLNMEIKTLMIGDLVYIRPWGADQTPDKITAISYNSWQGNDYADWVDFVEWDELSPNEIEPIPLTSEILEKNGFSINGLDIALFDRKGGDDFVAASNLQYVHELQHALKFCGIDKEIVL